MKKIIILALLLIAFAAYHLAGAFMNKSTIEASFTPGPLDKLGSPVYIRIFKEEAQLELWLKGENGYELFKIYPICAFSGGLGPKLKEGDGKSPEGFYFVTKNSLNPHSKFHLSFNLGYPNEYDRAQGYTGSYLMVHGECVSDGCYAMTNPQIEEIYNFVEESLKSGQSKVPVHIFPFKMIEKNIKKYESNQWFTFWQTLKPAYDIFENSKQLPVVTVKTGKYIINRGIE